MNLKIHVIIEEQDTVRFEVSMDDILCMEVTGDKGIYSNDCTGNSNIPCIFS